MGTRRGAAAAGATGATATCPCSSPDSSCQAPSTGAHGTRREMDGLSGMVFHWGKRSHDMTNRHEGATSSGVTNSGQHAGSRWPRRLGEGAKRGEYIPREGGAGESEGEGRDGGGGVEVVVEHGLPAVDPVHRHRRRGGRRQARNPGGSGRRGPF